MVFGLGFPAYLGGMSSFRHFKKNWLCIVCITSSRKFINVHFLSIKFMNVNFFSINVCKLVFLSENQRQGSAPLPTNDW